MYVPCSGLSKAFGKPCIFCKVPLQCGDDYGFSKTKSLTVNKITAPSKTLYFHTKCYYDNTVKASK